MRQQAECLKKKIVEDASKGWLEYVRQIAEKILRKAKASHSWDHTLRVVRLCERIGSVEQADMEVLLPAAYLHDIGRRAQDETSGRICHAMEGAVIAEPIVRKLPLTEDRKENILHCIRSHRFRGNQDPQTLEARVLFDADKLDAIGAVGIARTFLFAGELGARLHNSGIPVEKTLAYSENDTGYREYKVKLCKIKNRILTESGRKLAHERHKFMELFFERFLKEHEGES